MKNTPKIFSIPNILSFIRILLIPFIAWACVNERIYLSALLIVISGLTDILDGYIARHFNMITPLGKALDPIADKLTIGSILLSLGVKNNAVFLLFTIFIIKEIFMLIEGILIIKLTGTTYSAKWYGKVCTFILYSTILVLILWQTIPKVITAILLGVCISMVIFALISYTIMNTKKIKSLISNMLLEKTRGDINS